MTSAAHARALLPIFFEGSSPSGTVAQFIGLVILTVAT